MLGEAERLGCRCSNMNAELSFTVSVAGSAVWAPCWAGSSGELVASHPPFIIIMPSYPRHSTVLTLYQRDLDIYFQSDILYVSMLFTGRILFCTITRDSVHLDHSLFTQSDGMLTDSCNRCSLWEVGWLSASVPDDCSVESDIMDTLISASNANLFFIINSFFEVQGNPDLFCLME
jgi:hypothetical protein